MEAAAGGRREASERGAAARRRQEGGTQTQRDGESRHWTLCQWSTLRSCANRILLLHGAAIALVDLRRTIRMHDEDARRRLHRHAQRRSVLRRRLRMVHRLRGVHWLRWMLLLEDWLHLIRGLLMHDQRRRAVDGDGLRAAADVEGLRGRLMRRRELHFADSREAGRKEEVD